MRVVAIGGEPATGKTTLVSLLHERMSSVAFQYGKLKGHLDQRFDLALLGVYGTGQTFMGTDLLSMSVQPDFEKYIQKYNRNIILEGDRLFTLNNLVKLTEVATLRAIMLRLPEETLNRRHKERGDTQSEKFLKGRRTKSRNIKEAFPTIEEHSLVTMQQSKELADNIWDWLT